MFNYEIPAEILDLAFESLLGGALAVAVTDKIKKFIPENFHVFIPLVVSFLGIGLMAGFTAETFIVSLFVWAMANSIHDRTKK